MARAHDGRALRGLTALQRVVRRSAPDPSGCIVYLGARLAKGYGMVWDGRRVQLAHRVVLQDKIGRNLMPGELADHTCGNPPCVNREHLRVASPAQNSENLTKPPRNASGFRGVTKSGKRWIARVMAGGVSHYLGTFDTAEEAAEAARQGRLKMHTYNDADRRA